MTTVEVQFRYALHPTESAMIALGSAREVYGIRRVKVNAAEQTILVEYDATRLTVPIVEGLLLGAGISLTEEVALLPPQAAPDAALPETTVAK